MITAHNGEIKEKALGALLLVPLEHRLKALYCHRLKGRDLKALMA